jgi:PAS domain S-box-containing protein
MPALCADGGEIPVEIQIERLREDPPLFAGYLRDVRERAREREELGRTRRFLGNVAELAQLGGFELDLATGEMRWSEELERIHGLPPGGGPESLEAGFGYVHPDDVSRIRSELALLLGHGDGRTTLEYRLLRADGTTRAGALTAGRVDDEHGRPIRVVGAVQDITDVREGRGAVMLHRAVTEALHEWTTFDEGVQGLLRRLGVQMGWMVGALWVPRDEPDGPVLRCRAFWSREGGEVQDFEGACWQRAFKPGVGLPGRVWAIREPEAMADVRADRTFLRRSEAARSGLSTAVAFPALAGDEPLAILEFLAHERRPPGQNLSTSLAEVGRLVGLFLGPRRAQLAPPVLSDREREVLQLAADGLGAPEIAKQLVLSPATVRTHFQRIYERLGVNDRPAAVARALRAGLIR